MPTRKLLDMEMTTFQILIKHYGKMKEDAFMSITNIQNPDIDEDKTRV